MSADYDQDFFPSDGSVDLYEDNYESTFLLEQDDLTYYDPLLTNLYAVSLNIVPLVALSWLLRWIHKLLNNDTLRFLTTCILGLICHERYLRMTIPDDQLLIGRSLILCALMISTFFGSSMMAALIPIFVNEFCIFHGHPTFTSLRSIFMIMSMKSVERSGINSRLALIANLLDPATSIFGPPTKMHYDTSTPILIQFKKSSKNLLKSLIFLIIPDSLIAILITILPKQGLLGKLFMVYLQALIFRCSHYFSCSFAASLSSVEICRVKPIEWPRSISEVVVNWNIPMHRWLKTNIYIPSIRNFKSPLVAIFLTYVTSSLLHGFKFHIWSVLLSLGLISWLEQSYRHLLSCRFSACILARKCSYLEDGSCASSHRYTELNSNTVILFNILCTILAMTHLAYLGYIFSNNSDQETVSDALATWSELKYSTHILILAGSVPLIALKLLCSSAKPCTATSRLMKLNKTGPSAHPIVTT